MSNQIFVNLPVTDLSRSKAFFIALGFSVNPKFTNADAACIVISDSIYVMLLMQPFFQGFTRKAICDTRTHTEMLLALSTDSREQVDHMLERALANGGSEPVQAKDHGFMYQRSFEDCDGHLWEVFYMNEAEFPGA